MVTCLKFLNNILAAEFQIKSKLSKSEARVSSVIFLKVGWRIFFVVLILYMQVCLRVSTQIYTHFFLEMLFSYAFVCL